MVEVVIMAAVGDREVEVTEEETTVVGTTTVAVEDQAVGMVEEGTTEEE